MKLIMLTIVILFQTVLLLVVKYHILYLHMYHVCVCIDGVYVV